MRRWWGRAIVACCYALAQRRCISALTPRQQASPAGGFPSSRCGEGIVGTKYGPAFIHPSTRARACGLYSSSTPSPSSAPASSPVRGNAKPTLDQRTAWRLDLLLRNPGSVNATEASVRLRFIERANYEPPQVSTPHSSPPPPFSPSFCTALSPSCPLPGRAVRGGGPRWPGAGGQPGVRGAGRLDAQ